MLAHGLWEEQKERLPNSKPGDSPRFADSEQKGGERRVRWTCLGPDDARAYVTHAGTNDVTGANTVVRTGRWG
jgi:hypothetical protein